MMTQRKKSAKSINRVSSISIHKQAHVCNMKCTRELRIKHQQGIEFGNERTANANTRRKQAAVSRMNAK